VKRHNVHVWGTANPHITLKHERDSPTVNVLYAISKKVYSPFFFMENTIIGNTHLDMFTLWLVPMGRRFQLLISQQDRVPPDFHMVVQQPMMLCSADGC